MKLKIILLLSVLIQLPRLSAKNFETLNISAFQSEQLWKLSQLYSCARYFSPNPHVKAMDWYAFLQKGVDDLLPMTSETQVDSLLFRLFSPIIPGLQFTHSPLSDAQPATAPFYIKATTLNTGYQKSPTSSQLVYLQENKLQLPQTYCINLSSNLYACYSLTTDRLPEESKELKLLKKSLNYRWEKDFYTSPCYRLSNAILTGAYIQHFYAYYQEDGLDKIWEKEMKHYLTQVAECASYPEYLNISYLHYGHVKDGHLFVMNGYSKPGSLLGKFLPIYYPQITLGMSSEGNIYVKNCHTDSELKKGDELLSVNGQDTKELIAQKMPYVSAATEADRRGKVMDMFIFQSFKQDSILRLTLLDTNQQRKEVSISTNKGDNYASNTQEAFITEIEPGIWKVNPCQERGVSYKEFSKYIPAFNRAKGLIIDLRGYPNAAILPILSHFIDQPAMVGQILTPTFYLPNHQSVDYQITANSRWGVHPATEPYQKAWEYEQPVPVRITTPVCFLTDRESLSFGETIMELIKHHQIGPIIGEPTSGTNGDAVILKSPSIGFLFTGYKFLNHDGSPHHGIGVLPDISCRPQLEDIRRGEDTLLKEACQWITNSCNLSKQKQTEL